MVAWISRGEQHLDRRSVVPVDRRHEATLFHDQRLDDVEAEPGATRDRAASYPA